MIGTVHSIEACWRTPRERIVNELSVLELERVPVDRANARAAGIAPGLASRLAAWGRCPRSPRYLSPGPSAPSLPRSPVADHP